MRLVSAMALSLMTLSLLAACAGEPVWNKQDGSQAAFEKDTTACFRSASVQAQARTGNQGAMAAQIELRSSQGKIHDAAGAPRKGASLQESALRSQLYSQCMQRLGYRRGKP